ncbi:MAG: hypothetical protein K6G01_03625 [Eubacterium sp.]|nr:hypothetical protein [Eubacterium sp.]
MKQMKRIVVVILIGVLLGGAPIPYTIPVLQTQSVQTVYAATAKTITIKKADTKSAKKIHKYLSQGKALVLKVKGKSKKANKTVKKLNKKIKKVNGQGVIFSYKKSKQKGSYTYYKISSNNAKTYQYAVKFIQKLYSNTRASYMSLSAAIRSAYLHDVKLYKNETTRKMRIYYEMLISSIRNNPQSAYLNYGEDYYSDVTVKNGNSITCDIVNVAADSDMVNAFFAGYEGDVIKDASADGDSATIILRSFSEFKSYVDSEDVLDNSVWDYYFSLTQTSMASTTPDSFSDRQNVFCLSIDYADSIIMNTPSFGNLSDAMKVWAIAQSGYFACNFSRPTYGMVYSTDIKYKDGYKGMKMLYQNKAQGVCMNFALYENQVFEQLGISCWYNANSTLNHAWSVVKVKNSKNKTLWIPFDYGIGPAESLAVSTKKAKKLMSSESSRYKVYLKGIKGAPKKKNFTNSDFV